MPTQHFDWQDPLQIQTQWTQEEKQIANAVQSFAKKYLQPKVTMAFRNETIDPHVMLAMGEQGLLGIYLPTRYGGAGANYVSYGIVAREIERVDSGYRSMMSVQTSLVMQPIEAFGTEVQKEKYLPQLASGKWIGCFGLTEPDHGSDPQSMQTRARKVDGGYLVSGSKSWITNSPIADVLLVWAKETTRSGAEGPIRGFILEKGMKGLSTPTIDGGGFLSR